MLGYKDVRDPDNIQSGSFKSGLVSSIPLVLAATPFAIVYGALGQSLDMPFWLIMAISVMVFAGASQFIALTLLATGTQIGIIIFTVFLVNLRHMLYAVSLVPYFNSVKRWQKALMGFSLTDETFALVSARMASRHASKAPVSGFVNYYAGSALFMYLNWNLWTAIGFFVGSEFEGIQEFGLEIAMVVAFAGIVVSQLKNTSHYCCLLVAALAAIVSYDWPHQTGILFASFAGILAGLIADTLTDTTAEKHDDKFDRNQGK